MRALALAVVLLSSCGTMESSQNPPPPPRPAPATPSPGAEVRNAADRDAKNGQMVDVFGTYEQVSARKAPDAKPDGHAVIRLDDGTRIHLLAPYEPKAVRPPDEIAKHDGKPVVAKGLLMKECPPPPGGGAYAKVSCLHLEVVVMGQGDWDVLHGGDLE